MARTLFVSVPVADVAASTAFYEAVGFHKDESFATGADASAMRWSDDVVMMLCHRDRFAAQAPRPVANSRAESAVLFALALDSREAVDAVVTRAVAAGGTEGHPPENLGFMYSRAFDDPDGHSFGPLWMNMEAMPGPDAG